MGIMVVVWLFAGIIFAGYILMVWWRHRPLFIYLLIMMGMINIGIFVNQVFRWDIVGIEYDGLPVLLPILLGLTILIVYRSGTIMTFIRERRQPRIYQIVLILLPFALPLSLVMDFSEPERKAELLFPLPEGRWFVIQGGNSLLLNHHRRLQAQRYALDISKIGDMGIRSVRTKSKELSAYYAYGAHVSAPCGGTIVDQEDGHEERDVGTMVREQPWGNFIALHCHEEDMTVLLLHLQPGHAKQVDDRAVSYTHLRAHETG